MNCTIDQERFVVNLAVPLENLNLLLFGIDLTVGHFAIDSEILSSKFLSQQI